MPVVVAVAERHVEHIARRGVLVDLAIDVLSDVPAVLVDEHPCAPAEGGAGAEDDLLAPVAVGVAVGSIFSITKKSVGLMRSEERKK